MKEKTSEKKRKNRNRQIIEKMKRGEDLVAFDAFSSWFPPRPILKKDKKALEKLYGKRLKVVEVRDAESDDGW